MEYVDERDAEDALYAMDGKLFGNREIAVRCWLPVLVQATAAPFTEEWLT